MNSGQTGLQERVVNAFLDQFEDDPDWSSGFVHADFSDGTGQFGPVCTAFLVRRSPDSERPDYVPLDWSVVEALTELHKAHADNEEGFEKLDVEIAASDGRYRYRFYRDTGSPGGGPDQPSGSAHLQERYREIIARS